MAAAIKGYKMKLIMPANMSEERRLAMSAYGAELISVPSGQMEVARDLALQMQAAGEGIVLDQFSNAANPLAHFNVRACISRTLNAAAPPPHACAPAQTTGPEIWNATGGRVTHFVTRCASRSARTCRAR
jgi:cysteine synthase B